MPVFCVDCIHHSTEERFQMVTDTVSHLQLQRDYVEHLCDARLNLITGEAGKDLCFDFRIGFNSDALCGPDGLWFVKRQGG